MNIEAKDTPVWYWNPIAAVRYILGHPQCKNQLLYAPVKRMDSNSEYIYAELWTAEWWWKTQASFLVVSERACERECVKGTMSERTSQRASESDFQRERAREHVRERGRERVRERQSQIVRNCVSEFHWVRVGSVSRVSAPVLTASAKCKSVQKPHAILPETPGHLTGASKYF